MVEVTSGATTKELFKKGMLHPPAERTAPPQLRLVTVNYIYLFFVSIDFQIYLFIYLFGNF